MRRREGFVLLLMAFGTAVFGAAFYAISLNVSWIARTQRSNIRNCIVMSHTTDGLTRRTELPRTYARREHQVIMWQYLQSNLATMRDMLDFNAKVKKMHAETKRFIGNHASQGIYDSQIELGEKKYFKKYVEAHKAKDTDDMWLIPVISKMPDDAAKQGTHIKKDIIMPIVPDSSYNRQFYPADAVLDIGL